MQPLKDVMTTSVVYLPSETTIAEVARTMREQDIGDVVVADGPSLAGMATGPHLVGRAAPEGRDPEATTVGEVMTRDLVTVRPEDTIQQAALLMRDRAIRRLLVCDGQCLGGRGS